MNNVTLKQIITLLLMTAAMALILAMLPEQAGSTDQSDSNVSVIDQAAAK